MTCSRRELTVVALRRDPDGAQVVCHFDVALQGGGRLSPSASARSRSISGGQRERLGPGQATVRVKRGAGPAANVRGSSRERKPASRGGERSLADPAARAAVANATSTSDGFQMTRTSKYNPTPKG